MYEHLARAIDYTMNNLGPHGVPLMFFADWNDCLEPGQAASTRRNPCW